MTETTKQLACPKCRTAIAKSEGSNVLRCERCKVGYVQKLNGRLTPLGVWLGLRKARR